MIFCVEKYNYVTDKAMIEAIILMYLCKNAYCQSTTGEDSGEDRSKLS